MPTRAVCDDAVVAGLLLDALVVDGEQGGTSQIFQRNETEWDTGTVCCIRCWKVEHRCGKSRWRATDPKGWYFVRCGGHASTSRRRRKRRCGYEFCSALLKRVAHGLLFEALRFRDMR